MSQQILVNFQHVIDFLKFLSFSDAVQILTSAVIICTKANLKVYAFQFASQLLNPNYRSKVDKKYKRKIETIIR